MKKNRIKSLLNYSHDHTVRRFGYAYQSTGPYVQFRTTFGYCIDLALATCNIFFRACGRHTFNGPHWLTLSSLGQNCCQLCLWMKCTLLAAVLGASIHWWGPLCGHAILPLELKSNTFSDNDVILCWSLKKTAVVLRGVNAQFKYLLQSGIRHSWIMECTIDVNAVSESLSQNSVL